MSRLFHTTRSRFVCLTLLLTMAIPITGCSAASRAPRELADQAETVKVAATAAPSAPMADEAGAAGDSTASLVVADRMIIYNGYLSLEVADSAQAAGAIKAIANELGGYVTNANLQRSGSKLRGTITLRVPAESFDQAMAQVKELALTVKQDRTTTEDVTEQYTDLNARLKNLEATEEELRELLKTVRIQTGSAEDIMAVYRELTSVRGEIEQIKGKMQYLERLTALATITVELTPRQEVVHTGWNPGGTVEDALRALVRASQNLVDAAIWLVLFVLPILVAVLVPVLFLMWLIRRWWRSRRKAAAS